ncbi:hypothetical protein [Bradyrhizobium sp. USDA 4473]
MTDQNNAPRTTNDVYVASRETANTSLGNNGFQGASSDLPGDHTVMNRDYGMPADPSAAPGNWQTRPVNSEALPTAVGHHNPNSSPVRVAPKLDRQPSQPARGGNYQR